MKNYKKPPRVQAWMLGYYTALQEQNKMLSDFKLHDLSMEYRVELALRADKVTKHLSKISRI